MFDRFALRSNLHAGLFIIISHFANKWELRVKYKFREFAGAAPELGGVRAAPELGVAATLELGIACKIGFC